jgi:hypothetical protein
MLDVLPPQAKIESEIETIREGVEAGRQEPIAIPPRSLLTSFKEEPNRSRAGSRSPKDNRADETRWQIFSLLRHGVSGERLLGEVHALNENREAPLERGRVNEIITWAIARHTETKRRSIKPTESIYRRLAITTACWITCWRLMTISSLKPRSKL